MSNRFFKHMDSMYHCTSGIKYYFNCLSCNKNLGIGHNNPYWCNQCNEQIISSYKNTNCPLIIPEQVKCCNYSKYPTCQRIFLL